MPLKVVLFVDEDIASSDATNKEQHRPASSGVKSIASKSRSASMANTISRLLKDKFAVYSVSFRSTAVLLSSERLASLASLSSSSENDDHQLWIHLVVTESAKEGGESRLESSSIASNLSVPFLTVPIISDSSAEELRSAALIIAKFVGLLSSETRRCVAVELQKDQQRRLVQDAQLHTSSIYYQSTIAQCFDTNQQITGEGISKKVTDAASAASSQAQIQRRVGKVRDMYQVVSSDGGGDDDKSKTSRSTRIALITTDRQSGFDRQLAVVPYKGAVLNLTSAFWFERTKHIIPNHILSIPHPYVSIVRKCTPFPIEFVVRAYVTGSTSTSIWKNYQNGVRNYCGHQLPEGLVKNQKLWTTLLTPTTKEEDHDRPISAKEIVSEGWMTQEDWDVCSEAALQIFALGQRLASQRGLILVDTKYEFGRDDETGEIRLIDEVHTPDSSRYWLASTYEERTSVGLEPDNIDKEFLRLWFRQHCDPYNTEVPIPDAPRDLVLELSRRYITLYEMITWKDFAFFDDNQDHDDDDDDDATNKSEEDVIAEILVKELVL